MRRTLPMNRRDESPSPSGLSPSDSLSAFSAELGQNLVFGPQSLSGLGAMAREMSADRILLVTDRRIREAGHLEAARASLHDSALELVIFDRVPEDPTSDSVEAAARAVSGEFFDLIAAIGGGSVMDTAKAVNFLLTNGGRIEDYRGYGKAGAPMFPSIGVPTTAGTGSEAQSYAVIARSPDRQKMACGDPGARFKAVILDPDLLVTAPRDVLATSGLDALSHAVESLVSSNSHSISRMFSSWSWRLLDENCENAVNKRAPEALGQMMIGAYLAGMAVELSMLGAAHACANPLTARHKIRHGAAVGLLLPQVVRFNGSLAQGDYRLLQGVDRNDPSESLAARLEELRLRFDLPTSLAQVGVSRSSIAEMAEQAERQWTARFNPIPLTVEAATCIYESSL